MGTEETLITHRERADNQAAILFVHGFSGHPQRTWEKFPQLLVDVPELMHWDIHSFGYPTGSGLDLSGIWRSDPDLPMLAQTLTTTCSDYSPLDRYRSFALIAHSMGGLVVQRALLDQDDLLGRTTHVVLFGTPSNGLRKASWVKFWKRSFKNMGHDSAFIKNLRNRWNDTFGGTPPFAFKSIAGNQDEFVPSVSSLAPFDSQFRAAINGDHLSIVHVDKATHPSFQIVKKLLQSDRKNTLKPDRKSTLKPMTEFAHLRSRSGMVVRDALAPPILNEKGLVKRALRLDELGKGDEAIELLESNLKPEFTDAMGTLAGRHKRRWWMGGATEDAERALTLYSEAYTTAIKKGAADQAHYLAISRAFMELAYRGDPGQAAEWAQKALDHCVDAAPANKWSHATAGEARLILGQIEEAMESYGRALADPTTDNRERLSIYQQAARVLELTDHPEAAEDLEHLFLEQTP